MEKNKEQTGGQTETDGKPLSSDEWQMDESERKKIWILREMPIGSTLLTLYTIFFIAYTSITGLFNALMAIILLLSGGGLLCAFINMRDAFSLKKFVFNIFSAVFALLTFWGGRMLDLDERNLNYTIWFGHNMGKPADYCEIYYDDGDTYKGGWRRSAKGSIAKHGQGEFHYRAKDVNDEGRMHQFLYRGEYKNDLRHGQGTMYQRYGNTYKLIYNGQWDNNNRSGKGESRFYDKKGQLTNTYEGEYQNNTCHGHGTAKWYSHGTILSDMYIGPYVNGEKEGKGTYYWLIGEPGAYKGNFSKNIRTGYGSYYEMLRGDTTNLRIRYTGQWKDGKYHGHGILYGNDGKTIIHEGEFKDGYSITSPTF